MIYHDPLTVPNSQKQIPLKLVSIKRSTTMAKLCENIRNRYIQLSIQSANSVDMSCGYRDTICS